MATQLYDGSVNVDQVSNMKLPESGVRKGTVAAVMDVNNEDETR